MSKELRIKRTFPLNREELFKYLINPELIEQWAYPEGMTLRIPQYELKNDGHYRFEHSNDKGTYRCDGHFTEIVPNKKLAMIDERISGPDGKTAFENLKCTQILRDASMGTEIEVYQEGFQDEKGVEECRTGWEQSFDHLRILIDQMLGSQISI